MSKFRSFEDFYHYYLSQHRREGTRAMHFSGILSFFTCLLFAFLLRNGWFLVLGIILGYLPAVSSHFIFEGNKPATLKNPFYSLVADFRMFFELLFKKRPFSE